MHTTQSIVAALKRERAWLEKQSEKWRPKAELTYRRNDIRSACVTILRESPMDYSLWPLRRNRKELIMQRTRWKGAAAIRALCDLVDITICDVESCHPFMPKRRCGPLPVQTKQVSPETVEKIRQTKLEKRRQEEALIQRRADALVKKRVRVPRAPKTE